MFAPEAQVSRVTQQALLQLDATGSAVPDILCVCISALLVARSDNCLTKGLRAAATPHGQPVRHFPNAALDELCCQRVVAALQKNSPSHLIHVFCGHLVFKQLSNGCVWQLAGTPIEQALRRPGAPPMSRPPAAQPGFVIPHTRLFYQLSFCRRAGLPQRHPLLLAAARHFGVRRGARPLGAIQDAAAVFLPGRSQQANPSTVDGVFWPRSSVDVSFLQQPGAQEAAGRQLLPHALKYSPAAPRGAQTQLMQALGEVCSNYRQVSVAAALQAHCPLPAWLSRPTPAGSACKRQREHETIPAVPPKRPRLPTLDRSTDSASLQLQAESLPKGPQAGQQWLWGATNSSPILSLQAGSDLQTLMKGAAARQKRVKPRFQPSGGFDGQDAMPVDDQGRCLPGKCAVPAANAAAFVRDVMLQLVPKTLRGGAAGTRFLLRKLHSLLVSGRRDCLRCDTWLMVDCPVGAFAWAAQPKGSDAAGSAITHAIVRAWLLWLIVDVFIPLLGQCFYFTDSEQQAHTPLLYRKPVWLALRQHEMQRTRHQLGLHPIALRDDKHAECALQLVSPPLGQASIRLCPKTAGMRPIMNLSSTKECVVTAPIKTAILASLSASLHSSLQLTSKVQHVTGLSGEWLPPSLLAALGGAEGAAAKHATTQGSLNQKLAALHDVLSCVRRAFPHRVGAGVFGLDGMHTAWHVFQQALAARQAATGSPAVLYAVCIDVQACFDSINVQKLLSIVVPLIEQAGSVAHGPANLQHIYRIQKFASTVFSGAEQTSQAVPVPPHRTRFHRACTVNESSGLAAALPFQSISSTAAEGRSNAILNDLVRQTRLPASLAVSQLISHLTSHLVWTRRGILQPAATGAAASSSPRVFVQSRGIPQGSVLSTGLCNLYYGDMELNCVLPAVMNAAEADSQHAAMPPLTALMRLTDDSMLVSTSKHVVDAFVACMLDPSSAGVKEYNCTVNPSKTSLGSSDTPAACIMPWCGLLWNLASGGVELDMQRSTDVRHLSDVTPVTGNLAAAAGLPSCTSAAPAINPVGFYADTSLCACMVRQLMSYSRPRLHPLLLDAGTNGFYGVLYNLHCTFVLAWSKLCSVLHRQPAVAAQFRAHRASPSAHCGIAAVLKQVASQFGNKAVQMASGRMAKRCDPPSERDSAATPAIPVHGTLLGGDAAHMLQTGGTVADTSACMQQPAQFREAQSIWQQLGLPSNQKRMLALGSTFAIPPRLVLWLVHRAAAAVLGPRFPKDAALLLRLKSASSANRLASLAAETHTSLDVNRIRQQILRAEAYLGDMRY